ncbi:putative Pre-mRNA-processing factor 39 [Paratrimastix pyriformis]|uniref:Pre-mRNA-processing factor 39 n=1 Tax=Paratrimastix pyriformis TaxID=342808 RepID=A0ABQ8UTB1_9EUKA|nr:putative Pre-mRNA-processing factor 39 [Paratrimastix pyriformis]
MSGKDSQMDTDDMDTALNELTSFAAQASKQGDSAAAPATSSGPASEAQPKPEKTEEDKHREEEEALKKKAQLKEQQEPHREKIRKNPNDFNAWTSLIQLVEKENDIESLRACLSPFLEAYPLCYVYWKKWADAEHHHKTGQEIPVFEHGVQAIPNSIDLWLHYLGYMTDTMHAAPEEVIRLHPPVSIPQSPLHPYSRARSLLSLYERAVSCIGNDFKGQKLWQGYADYLVAQGRHREAGALWVRILKTPLGQLKKLYDSFVAYAPSRPLEDLAPPSELADLRAKAAQPPAPAALTPAAAAADTKPQAEKKARPLIARSPAPPPSLLPPRHA